MLTIESGLCPRSTARFVPPVEYAHNYFRLAEKLEALLRAPFDLVELDVIKNPYFKEAVEKTKVPVYEIA
jgi:uncharacterized protein